MSTNTSNFKNPSNPTLAELRESMSQPSAWRLPIDGAAKLTKTQARVLQRAMARPAGHVCPTPGLYAAAQTAVLDSLAKRGLITRNIAPVITTEGRKALS